CCGISVKTDGTENDEIFNYDNLIDNKDKENNDRNNIDNELEGREERDYKQDYNNWNGLNFNDSN
ncbi:7971_t:CDS:1, partial [Funneliformis geosporum]